MVISRGLHLLHKNFLKLMMNNFMRKYSLSFLLPASAASLHLNRLESRVSLSAVSEVEFESQSELEDNQNSLIEQELIEDSSNKKIDTGVSSNISTAASKAKSVLSDNNQDIPEKSEMPKILSVGDYIRSIFPTISSDGCSPGIIGHLVTCVDQFKAASNNMSDFFNPSSLVEGALDLRNSMLRFIDNKLSIMKLGNFSFRDIEQSLGLISLPFVIQIDDRFLINLLVSGASMLNSSVDKSNHNFSYGKVHQIDRIIGALVEFISAVVFVRLLFERNNRMFIRKIQTFSQVILPVPYLWNVLSICMAQSGVRIPFIEHEFPSPWKTFLEYTYSIDVLHILREFNADAISAYVTRALHFAFGMDINETSVFINMLIGPQISKNFTRFIGESRIKGILVEQFIQGVSWDELFSKDIDKFLNGLIKFIKFLNWYNELTKRGAVVEQSILEFVSKQPNLELTLPHHIGMIGANGLIGFFVNDSLLSKIDLAVINAFCIVPDRNISGLAKEFLIATYRAVPINAMNITSSRKESQAVINVLLYGRPAYELLTSANSVLSTNLPFPTPTNVGKSPKMDSKISANEVFSKDERKSAASMIGERRINENDVLTDNLRNDQITIRTDLNCSTDLLDNSEYSAMNILIYILSFHIMTNASLDDKIKMIIIYSVLIESNYNEISKHRLKGFNANFIINLIIRVMIEFINKESNTDNDNGMKSLDKMFDKISVHERIQSGFRNATDILAENQIEDRKMTILSKVNMDVIYLE